MSEELQKQLAAFLAAMLEAAKSGGEWAAGQMPLLIQEKILLGRLSNTITVLGAVALGVYLLVLARRVWRWAPTASGYQWDEGGQYFVASIATVATGLYWLFVCGLAAESALKVWLAPRLYIVDWLIGMAK